MIISLLTVKSCALMNFDYNSIKMWLLFLGNWLIRFSLSDRSALISFIKWIMHEIMKMFIIS